MTGEYAESIMGVLMYSLLDMQSSKDTTLRSHTQGRLQPDQCYFMVHITGNNFDSSL